MIEKKRLKNTKQNKPCKGAIPSSLYLDAFILPNAALLSSLLIMEVYPVIPNIP